MNAPNPTKRLKRSRPSGTPLRMWAREAAAVKEHPRHHDAIAWLAKKRLPRRARA